MYIWIYIYIYMDAYICIYVSILIYIYTWILNTMCMYVYVYIYTYGIHIFHSDVSCRSYPGICFLMISLDIWNDTFISNICSFGYII